VHRSISASLNSPKPSCAREKNQRMLGDQSAGHRLEIFWKMLPRDTRIDIFSVPAAWRDYPGVEHRPVSRDRLEAAIAVPQQVTEIEHAPAVICGKDIAIRAQIGNVVDLHVWQPAALLIDERRRGLDRSELPREIGLLVIDKGLTGKYQNAIVIHRCTKPITDFGGKRPR